VKEMVLSDLKLFEKDKYLLEGGHDIMNFHE
jgi:GDPmannose 4,6-dehydratase